MKFIDEKLIELVRDRPELYNPNDKRHLDLNHKNNVWQEIGNVLKKDKNHCKKRWESIRHQFRRAVRTRKNGGLDKWKYSDELSFLLPYMKTKRLVFQNTEGIEDPSEGNSNNQPTLDLNRGKQQPAAEEDLQPIAHMNIKLEEFGDDEDADNPESAAPTRKRNDIVTETIESFLTQKTAEQNENCDLDSFFEYIKVTMRNFTRLDVLSAKRTIFNFITDMERKYVEMHIDGSSNPEPPVVAKARSDSQQNCLIDPLELNAHSNSSDSSANDSNFE